MAYTFTEYEYKWQRAGGGRLVRKLLLPPSVGHKRAYEQAAKSGIRSLTPDGALGRRVDDPLGPGQTAIWSRDEREIRGGRPLMLRDERPGRTALLIPNTANLRAEALAERADEHFHYGQDRLPIPAPLPDYNALLHDLADIALRHHRGRHTYGPTTGGLITKDG